MLRKKNNREDIEDKHQREEQIGKPILRVCVE
jgi:hypothetical protein